MNRLQGSTRRGGTRKIGSGSACLAVATLVAACGTSKPAAPPLTPKQQLRAAGSNLYSQPTLEFQLHLSATPDQLQSLDPRIPTPFDPLITGASVVIETSSANGQPLSTLESQAGISSATDVQQLKSADLDLALDEGSQTHFELRLVDGVLYARADVNYFLGLAGQSSSALQPVLSSIPAGSQFNFARAFLAGQWVSFDAATALQGLLSTAPVVPSADQKAQLDQLISAIGAVYEQDITVTPDGAGPNGTTQLALSANGRTLVTDFVRALAMVLPTGSFQGFDPSKVPSKVYSGTAQVSGTSLTGLQIDLSQFMSGPPKASLPLAVTVSHPSVSITAPSGAVPATLAGLGPIFKRLGGAKTAIGADLSKA